MKKKLKKRAVKECLLHYPSITNLEEMCAVLNIDKESISKEDYETATWLIERNRLRLQVRLKEVLMKKNKVEQVYKMICDESELKRWGVKVSDVTNFNANPVIEIKSSDPDIIDKIKSL